MFFADLHLHSKFSRATSRDCDLEHMAIWACKKGVSVLGTGDFTHPEWFAEIQDKLIPAEPGLFRLRDDLQKAVSQETPRACQATVRFLLQVEISTIYKKGDRTRKVHHVIYAPGFEEAKRLGERLARIGNVASDGRPILGLDSRDLLEITLECGDGCYLIPAHVWTPWFAVLGSKSGFDAIEECYDDLSDHIFALETGLSSDPPMNWRLSCLDRYTLVSNSDAHSPPKIAREACAFDTDMDYFAMRRALETREGYSGTVEFFPEEGKYHLDGHRKCGVRLSPPETRQHEGRCPECGKPLTVGVMNRVDELADRPEGTVSDSASPFRSFVPLPEVISEVHGVGDKSKKVAAVYEKLVSSIGPELFILEHAPAVDIEHAGAPSVAEAITRMRKGRVIRDAGYDGEYGTIRLFQKTELTHGKCTSLLFDLPAESSRPKEKKSRQTSKEPDKPDGRTSHLPVSSETVAQDESSTKQKHAGLLDSEQQAAVDYVSGPLLIIAGPGTGKTRTLTERITRLVTTGTAAPEQCLAITFSRRAAREMADRLGQQLSNSEQRVPVMTFHSLGLSMLREHHERLELPRSFRVAGDAERVRLLAEISDLSEQRTARWLTKLSQARRSSSLDALDPEMQELARAYQQELRHRDLLDFDDLILLPGDLLERDPQLAEQYRDRWTFLSVDEFQDIDVNQYRLIRLLTRPTANVCVIGDPDQSIYGFRGSDPQMFQRFLEDYPTAHTISLRTNYRSSQTIVGAAMQAIAPSSLAPDRTLEALSDNETLIEIQSCATERAEAEFVVHTIERLIGGHAFFSIDSGRVEHDEDTDPLAFDDFAVLYRTETQGEVIAEALHRSGIPFQRKSHRALLEDPSVQAALAFMHDMLPSAESEGTPISASDLVKRAADAVWKESPEITERLPDLNALAEQCNNDASRFVNELVLGSEVDLWDPRGSRVSLLTLHAAKGLEFRVVFVVGCEEGLLPLRWGSSADSDTAEERRLFFVGMTRARDRLFLTHARKRLWQGKLRQRDASPFLQEISEALAHRAEQSKRRKAKRTADRQRHLFD